MVDAEHLAVVINPDQEVASLGVQEGRNGLERRVGDVLVVLAVLPQVPAQARLELQRL